MVLGYVVKTLESKETKASKEITVTHNSVFAAHRLQCRMTISQGRHPAFCFANDRGLRGSHRCSHVAAGHFRQHARQDLMREKRRWLSSFLSVVQVDPGLNVFAIG